MLSTVFSNLSSEPLFPVALMAIVSCSFCSAVIGRVTGYDSGHAAANSIRDAEIASLNEQLRELRDIMIWRDFPAEDDRGYFAHLLQARQTRTTRKAPH